jgi:pyruvate dehydrogenase E2 component (dihydrolipoamide acetyltransferase)
MAVKVAMPKLGLIMVDGIVVKWLKADGEAVKKGEPVAVIMSKKVTYEIEAPADGSFHPVVKLKETVPTSEAIAYITAPGEAVPEKSEAVAQAGGAVSAPTAAAPAASTGQFVFASPAARRVAKELGVDLSQVKGTGPEGRISEEDVRAFTPAKAAPPVEVPATSMARKLGEQYGVDLAKVTGTGPGGRVTETDVEAFVEAQKKAPVASAMPGRGRVIPFAGTRLMIAEHMMDSLRSTAQVTTNTEVDVTEMVKLRNQLKTKFDLTYTDIIIKAVTIALKEHPMLNSTQVGDEIHILEDIHIGVAVALEDGLIVPVVRNADKLTLSEVAKQTRALAEGARAGTLAIDQVTGSTFTITNVGIFGMDSFTPVINTPEVAILGVGRIIEKPAVFEGEIVKRFMMGLSLTFDHRIVDGAPASLFLKAVSGLLEKPYLLFV